MNHRSTMARSHPVWAGAALALALLGIPTLAAAACHSNALALMPNPWLLPEPDSSAVDVLILDTEVVCATLRKSCPLQAIDVRSGTRSVVDTLDLAAFGPLPATVSPQEMLAQSHSVLVRGVVKPDPANAALRTLVVEGFVIGLGLLEPSDPAGWALTLASPRGADIRVPLEAVASYGEASPNPEDPAMRARIGKGACVSGLVEARSPGTLQIIAIE